MRLVDLAGRIGSAVRCPGRDFRIGPEQVYAGDRISDLLNAAGDHALLITNLASRQLLRVAELMDIPGICFVNNQEPDPTLIAAAREHGTALLVSPAGLFETCGRVHACLNAELQART